MKRFYVVLAAAMLGLAACGDSNNSGTGDSIDSENTSPMTSPDEGTTTTDSLNNTNMSTDSGTGTTDGNSGGAGTGTDNSRTQPSAPAGDPGLPATDQRQSE